MLRAQELRASNGRKRTVVRASTNAPAVARTRGSAEPGTVQRCQQTERVARTLSRTAGVVNVVRRIPHMSGRTASAARFYKESLLQKGSVASNGVTTYRTSANVRSVSWRSLEAGQCPACR